MKEGLKADALTLKSPISLVVIVGKESLGKVPKTGQLPGVRCNRIEFAEILWKSNVCKCRQEIELSFFRGCIEES